MESEAMSISTQREHPVGGVTLSIETEPEEKMQLTFEDVTETLTIPMDISQVQPVTDYPDSYIGQTICASPILPVNSGVKFPSDLTSAIETFRDVSKDIRARTSSQRLVERYLVEKGSCSRLNPAITQDFRLRLFGTDSEALDSVLESENSLNANIHDDLACVVEAIIYDGKMSGLFAPSQRERVRNWFPSIRQIGSESIEGYALKTSFTNDTNLFVMKCPRNPKNDELVHEAVVGFYALNKLRHILPNYMYIYGYLKCSPVALENKQVVTWCSSSNPGVSYLITENIRNAVSISNFIVDPNIGPLDVLAVLCQVFNALNLAYKNYEYTHYDLHSENIMVRKYSKIVAIPYFGASRNVIGYIASSYVPYIIDYGFSRVTVGGIGFGKIGLEHSGIETERAFPMYDIYKIIGFLGQKIYTTQRADYYSDIIGILEKLFSFFGDGTLLNRVQKRLNSRGDYYIPSERYRSITHDQYLDWLQNKSGIRIPVHVNLLTLMSQGIYTAPINTSMDTCSFYNMISSEHGPETSLEYCEAVSAINSDSILSPNLKQEAVKWLNENFDASQYFIDTSATTDAKIQQVFSIYQRRQASSTDFIPEIFATSELITPTFVNSYRSQIINLLKIKDITSDIISYIKASVCSLASQGKLSPYRTRIDDINNLTINWTQFITSQREILKKNLALAKTINWASIISDRKILTFWTTEHENLILAV